MSKENQTLDLLVADNNPVIARCTAENAGFEYGLKGDYFTNGKDVMNYLKSCSDENLPKAFLIDSNLIYSEVDWSLEIFNYLNQREATENFRYVTFEIRNREITLRNKTNAKIIKYGACDENDQVYLFMASLAKNKE